MTIDEQYTIEITRGRFLWCARVTTIGIGKPEWCPTFRARTEQRARARAECWCDRDHAKRYSETGGSYEYIPLDDGAIRIGERTGL